ncbi:MAG TPA: Holliday junction resolvase RuvX [Candidatus Absconditabacterales bacterium]|nr:Holliday junction resolvase RuvX [Candidatus Absconditabacterales bacterium]
MEKTPNLEQGTYLSIDYGTKTLGLGLWTGSIPLPLGNIDNNGMMRFSLMGLIGERRPTTILIGYPKHELMRSHIDHFIKTLQTMYEGTILRIDENYTSIQAQARTGVSGKHSAHDTLSAMELIERFINSDYGVQNNPQG